METHVSWSNNTRHSAAVSELNLNCHTSWQSNSNTEPSVSGRLKVVPWTHDWFWYFSPLLLFYIAIVCQLVIVGKWRVRALPPRVFFMGYNISVQDSSCSFHSVIIWVLFLAGPGILEEREAPLWVFLWQGYASVRDVSKVKLGFGLDIPNSHFGHFPAFV